MKQLLIPFAAVAAMFMPASVLAHGGPPVDVSTDTARIQEVQLFAGPCGGGPGLVTLDYRNKVHVTEFADGHVNFSANSAGTFAFEPFDPTEPSATGRFRNGFSVVETQNSFSNPSVFVVVGTDENGDQLRFRISSQFVVSNGDVRVDNFSVACG